MPSQHIIYAPQTRCLCLTSIKKAWIWNDPWRLPLQVWALQVPPTRVAFPFRRYRHFNNLSAPTKIQFWSCSFPLFVILDAEYRDIVH